MMLPSKVTRISSSLYEDIERFRKRLESKTGIDISFVQACDKYRKNSLITKL